MSKIMVITSFPPSWEKLADITTATHRKYCAEHGYDYFADCSEVSGRLSSPWVDDPPKTPYAPLRTMIKFPLLEHFLTKESCQKEYSHVVWLDADCVVTNYTRPLTDWVLDSREERGQNGDVILASDVNGLHPTVIMMRNTVDTRGLVWACKEAGMRMYQQHSWSDIMAFRFFLATPPYEHLVRYYPAQELCAMPPGVYPIPSDVRALHEWTPESLTLHLSALGLQDRIALASKWVQEFNLL